jgi:hypothetical protein
MDINNVIILIANLQIPEDACIPPPSSRLSKDARKCHYLLKVV